KSGQFGVDQGDIQRILHGSLFTRSRGKGDAHEVLGLAPPRVAIQCYPGCVGGNPKGSMIGEMQDARHTDSLFARNNVAEHGGVVFFWSIKRTKGCGSAPSANSD